jgi:hypothetical protein
MRRRDRPNALGSLALLLAILCACTSTRYQNVIHANYGDAEYKTDLAQCRQQNSTTKTIQGYDIQTQVTVDEAKASACMTDRGWQPVSK